MSDFFANMVNASSGDLSPEDRRKAHDKAKTIMARARERHEYIYQHLNGLELEQLKAIYLLLASCQEDELAGTETQIALYKGWIGGIVGSQYQEFLVIPDDIFPHFEEKDNADFLAELNELDEKPTEVTKDGGHYL